MDFFEYLKNLRLGETPTRGDVQESDRILNEGIRNKKLPNELRASFPKVTSQISPEDLQTSNMDWDKLYKNIYSPEQQNLEQNKFDPHPLPDQDPPWTPQQQYIRGTTAKVGGDLIRNFSDEFNGLTKNEDIVKQLAKDYNYKGSLEPSELYVRPLTTLEGKTVIPQTVGGGWDPKKEDSDSIKLTSGDKNDSQFLDAAMHELGHRQLAQADRGSSAEEHPDKLSDKELRDIIKNKDYLKYNKIVSGGHHSGFNNYPIENMINATKATFIKNKGLQELDNPKFDKIKYLLDKGMLDIPSNKK